MNQFNDNILLINETLNMPLQKLS